MVGTFLITVAVELAAAGVLVAFFVAWGYSGGDGEAPNPVAPVLGLTAFIGAVGAFVTTLSLLNQP